MEVFDPALDYCTAWFDRLFSWDWGRCCYDHDVAWAQLQNFHESNVALAQCVDAVLPGMGFIMALGVGSIVGFAIWCKAHVKAWWRRRRERLSAEQS